MKKILILALVLFLFGCGDKTLKTLHGTYDSSWNGDRITFSPNGTAVVSRQDGGPITIGGDPLPYTIEGEVIKVGALQFKLLSNGNLDGGAAFGLGIKK